MQAILSPQEAGDLLFYLMNVMSTVSASTTTPSIARTSSFIEEGWMLDMALGQQTRLRNAIETAISKEQFRRSGQKRIRSQNRRDQGKTNDPSRHPRIKGYE